MRKRLFELIVCPLCKGELTIESFDEIDTDEFVSGVLVCTLCDEYYPLIDGIPRLLPPSLQSMLWETHPSFYSLYRQSLPSKVLPSKETLSSGSDLSLVSQRETARSFGFEWETFHEILPEYKYNFQWYFEGFEANAFTGKRVLDAGCGTGRHAFHMARSGASQVIAMDISRAIDVARCNNRENLNVSCVQADIYHPPFREAKFDLVYSLGVLHHLPNPEEGFQTLLGLVKDGGYVNVYLYWNLEGQPAWRRAALALITQARRITTRLPHPVLKNLSFLIAAALELVFVLPARVLDHYPATRALADRLPLGQYRSYSFRVLYNDQFDRFSAPIENRYSRAEVQSWLDRAQLRDSVILGGAGWRASGRRFVKMSAARPGEELAASARRG